MSDLSHEKDVYMGKINAAAALIRQAAETSPELLLVLGSGLGSLAEQVEKPVILPYAELPGFAGTSVQGHRGRLLLGRWAGRFVAVMQGRFHYYEGHDMQDVVLPIRVMQRVGVRRLILTNAAGGLDPAMNPGDLMLINDHIGLFAESPLRGLNLDAFGPRFPDQSRIYDPDWLDLARHCAADLALKVHTGVYAWCRGPQYETPAEIRLLAKLGAAAVGMSTVPEAITATHGGMKVLAISCITNMAAGILDEPLSHDDVMAVGDRAAAGTIRLLSAILRKTPED
jgi:purine-nucleoside phosphorylase